MLGYQGSSPFDERIKEQLRRRNSPSPPFKIFPELYSGPILADVELALFLTLNRSYPDYDWSPLLTQAGQTAFPRGGIARALPWDVPADYRKNLRIIGSLMFSGRLLGAVSIKTTSSTAQPMFTSNPAYKRQIVRFWQHFAHEILNATSFEELLQMPVAIVYAGMSGYRLSADAFKSIHVTHHPEGDKISDFEWKQRTVWDYLGRETTSRKDLLVPIPGHPEAQACRSRNIAQESQTVNLPCVFFYKAIQRGMFDWGAPLWKSGTGQQNIAKLDIPNFPYVVKLDVKELDRHLSFPVLSSLRAGYRDAGATDQWCRHLERVVHCPMLCIEDYPNPTTWAWTYSPRRAMDVDPLEFDYGMPSGFAGVSPEDKAAFSMYMLTALQRTGIVGETGVTAITNFVNNKCLNVRCINSGDDTLIAFKTRGFADSFLSEVTSMGMNVQPEARLTYLGQDVKVRKDGIVEVMPQLVNSLKNIVVPEQAWGSRRRLHPGFGLIERNKYYATNPEWQNVWLILNGILAEHNLPRLDEYIANASNIENQPPMVSEMYNLADATFIMNPDSINYKILEDDVSRNLLDLFYLTFEVEDAQIFDKIFTEGGA